MGLSESVSKEDRQATLDTKASFSKEDQPVSYYDFLSRREEIIVLFHSLWRRIQIEAHQKQEKTLLMEDAKKAKKRKEKLHAGKEIAGKNNMRRKRAQIPARKGRENNL